MLSFDEIQRYAQACVNKSWIGSTDPAEHGAIEQEFAEAQAVIHEKFKWGGKLLPAKLFLTRVKYNQEVYLKGCLEKVINQVNSSRSKEMTIEPGYQASEYVKAALVAAGYKITDYLDGRLGLSVPDLLESKGDVLPSQS